MLFDFIVYSEDSAVGIVLLDSIELYGIGFVKEYKKKIDKEILKELGNMCYWLINDSNILKVIKSKYKSPDIFEPEDALYIAVLVKKHCKGLTLNQILNHDYNYAELAKYSDTDFVELLLCAIMNKTESLKGKITGDVLAEQRFLVAEILYERKGLRGFIYLATFYYLGLGTKKSKQKAIKCLNEVQELYGGDLSDFFSFIDNSIKNTSIDQLLKF